MFKNLIKAVVGVAITPVAIIADIATLPASSLDLRRGPFDKTAAVLNSVGDNITKALK